MVNIRMRAGNGANEEDCFMAILDLMGFLHQCHGVICQIFH